VFIVALFVFAVSPAQSMSSSGATIVPILQLLLGEEFVDPTLPIADAGVDQEVLVGELVELDGSGSSDPTGQALSYLWSFVSKPESSVAMLTLASSTTPEFVIDVPGVYVVQLIVNNGIKDSLPSTTTVTNTNRLPLADAGVNVVVPLSQAVQLNGSNSSDIDGDPLSYAWSFSERPPTSAADFIDALIETPTFTPDIAGNYILELVVNDGTADSLSDQVEVLAGVQLSLNVADVFFGIGRETTATVNLSLPAPAQGLDITLAANESIIGLSDTLLTFAEGETQKQVTLTGLSTGITNLTASGTNIDQESIAIEVSGALISIDAIAPLSPSASRSVAISLSSAAPTGGVTVDLEVLDTAVASISPPSVFIAEGQFTPNQNAQVTGVGLGETVLRATGASFAPDERAIEVALAASFDSLTLSVPETLTRDLALTLDAPAPVGGVSFDLSIVGDQNFGVQNTVTIDEGQTQSQPIVLTGLMEGVAILRARSEGFIDADATITVVDAPNVFLRRNGSTSLEEEVFVGIGLQQSNRIQLEVTPTSAVDILVSVPENSGVLLATSPSEVGTDSLVLEDVVSTTTSPIYFQGVEIGDDVPLSIQAVLANTTTPAGYEAVLSTIDVDPSGVYVNTADFSINTFTTNRVVSVQTGILFDDENGELDGNFRQSMAVRAGESLQVMMQVDDPNLLTLPDGATGTLVILQGSTSGSIGVTPVAAGTATVSIANQPATGFALPANFDDNAQITINTPAAYLRSTGSNSHLLEAVVGLDLQRPLRVGFESSPPDLVDVQISVPAAAGVAVSSSRTVAGSTQLTLEDVSGSQSPVFYLQGLANGDDVPITINVFNANTTTPTGFNVLSSSLDVDPSGLYVSSSDYSTTTFSNNRSVTLQSALLFDAETPGREGERANVQDIRAGLDLTVPMQTSAVGIASLPAGETDNIVFAGGSNSATISVEPVSAGQAIISIASLPRAFSVPSNNDDRVVVTVSAPNAFLRSLGSASYQAEAAVGIDLQTPQYIGLAVTPPALVDIRVSVPAASGVLLSTDATAGGVSSILFEDVLSTRSPIFYIQGTLLGDDVPVTVEVFEADSTTPIGYNSLLSTVDVDPSGVYMRTGDYQTNNFAPNRSIMVTAAILYDDETASLEGQQRADQAVRGGLDLSVPLAVDDDNVVVLPGGASDTVIINAGQSSGSIDVDPQTAGVATVSITAQPNAAFTLPSNRDGDVVITVTAPDARFSVSTTSIGDELQTRITVSLEQAPPNPVEVTVDVTAPAVALVSKDAATAGVASISFANVTSTSVGDIYVQGLSLNAATQIRVSAPGFNDDTAEVQVVNSGFRLSGNFNNIAVGGTRNLSVSSVRLNSNGTFSATQQVRGGASFDIAATSSLPGVGTINSPITLIGGGSSTSATFTAVAPGTTTVEINQPSGFTPPAGLTDGDITVE
jgi:hypothetical protein